MTCGIYAIVCDKTWRSYVGQSENCENRFLRHQSDLMKNCHINSQLQNDYNLYGCNSFHYEVIEELSDYKNLCDREIYWMNYSENLYNMNSCHTQINIEQKYIDKLWSNVKILSDNECWEWQGRVDNKQYGIMYVKKQAMKTHRISYFLTNPFDNQNLIVRHKCNNKKCCNPNHLILGTNGDNIRDRLDQDKNQYKLNWEYVKIIRDEFCKNPNISSKDFENWFFDISNINMTGLKLISIGLNERWKDKDYTPPIRKVKRILEFEVVEYIRNLLFNKTTPKDIVKLVNEKFNIPITTTNVCHINTGRTYNKMENN